MSIYHETLIPSTRKKKKKAIYNVIHSLPKTMVFHPYMGYQGKSDQVTRATSPQNWNEHELDNFPRVFIYSPLFDYVVHKFIVNIIEDFRKRRSI